MLSLHLTTLQRERERERQCVCVCVWMWECETEWECGSVRMSVCELEYQVINWCSRMLKYNNVECIS